MLRLVGGESEDWAVRPSGWGGDYELEVVGCICFQAGEGGAYLDGCEAVALLSRPDADAVAGAVDRRLEWRSRLSLDGLKFLDLIDDVRDR